MTSYVKILTYVWPKRNNFDKLQNQAQLNPVKGHKEHLCKNLKLLASKVRKTREDFPIYPIVTKLFATLLQSPQVTQLFAIYIAVALQRVHKKIG